MVYCSTFFTRMSKKKYLFSLKWTWFGRGGGGSEKPKSVIARNDDMLACTFVVYANVIYACKNEHKKNDYNRPILYANGEGEQKREKDRTNGKTVKRWKITYLYSRDNRWKKKSVENWGLRKEKREKDLEDSH